MCQLIVMNHQTHISTPSPTLDKQSPKSPKIKNRKRKKKTYTCTLLTATLASGVCGMRKTDDAISALTTKTTVVKYPNTFWARTRVECMVGSSIGPSQLDWLDELELDWFDGAGGRAGAGAGVGALGGRSLGLTLARC